MNVSALPDWISYDPTTGLVTIDGIKLHRELFSFLGNDAIGSVGKIVRRTDGVVTVDRVPQ